MKLSIIIPCYNEKPHLPALLQRVMASPVEDKEIILVDDASSDGTTELIRETLEKEVAKTVYHDGNMGKGAALNRGFQYAREKGFEYVITMDGDGQHAADDIPGFIERPEKHLIF